LLHVASASADSANGVGEGEGVGDDVSGVFAERMAGSEGGLNASLGEDTRSGDRDGEDRGLCVFGELELVFWALEDQLRQREAESFIGFVEYGASDGEVVVEIAAHSDELGALTRK
jgi:hypothetical protein